MNNPPPIFNRRLTKLPAHIHQSDDLQTLVCKRCNTATNLGYEPNYYEFLSNHAHVLPYPSGTKVKPWPSYQEL
jgi:hypothetical protein